MKRFNLTFPSVFAAVAVALTAAPAARAGDAYKIDPVHSANYFKIKHANVGNIYGRFNVVDAAFTLDEADPARSQFQVTIQVGSVDTNNEKRDAHLKSPDFFNAAQYKTITFTSTAVKKGADNRLEVTGDLSLHGVTKSVTVPVEITGRGEFPKGTQRVGIEATVDVKQSDFGMKVMPGALSDEVRFVISIQGVKQ